MKEKSSSRGFILHQVDPHTQGENCELQVEKTTDPQLSQQGCLNWPPDDNASLMDHVRIYSLGYMSTSKHFLVLYLEKEVLLTMKMTRECGRQVSAENVTPFI